jgi:Fe-S-cluster-containing dehydrogenase component
MTRLGMVIDLSKCVGCGACAFACKTENNTRNRGNGQSHNWADFLMHTEGTFPNVTHFVMPVLCNHCDDAPCIKICPGNPEKAGNKPYKALFKTPEGITCTTRSCASVAATARPRTAAPTATKSSTPRA